MSDATATEPDALPSSAYADHLRVIRVDESRVVPQDGPPCSVVQHVWFDDVEVTGDVGLRGSATWAYDDAMMVHLYVRPGQVSIDQDARTVSVCGRPVLIPPMETHDLLAAYEAAHDGSGMEIDYVHVVVMVACLIVGGPVPAQPE